MSNLLSEDDLQISIMQECELRANQNELWGRIFHVPNGGHRNIATASRMKRMGVKRGVPDLIVPVYREAKGGHPAYCGAFIELKVRRNKPGEYQHEWLTFLREQGYFVAVVWDSADEAIQLISWYLGENDV